MSGVTPNVVLQRLHSAAALIRQGRAAEACGLLSALVQGDPRNSEARRLYGVALGAAGDLAGSERELRAAVAADKRQPLAHVSLGDLLARLGRTDEAERAYRAALALDRLNVAAAVSLSRMLVELGRPADAAKATAPLAAAPAATHEVLNAHANALKADGRLEEALGFYRRAVETAPTSGVAEHNLAATLGDAGRFAEAEAACRRAADKGLDAPETWLVRARALLGQDRYDEAEGAFREALRRRPSYSEAHRELAQLIWMRTEDASQALQALDDAIAAHPQALPLAVDKAKVLIETGDAPAAYAALEPWLRRPDVEPYVHLAAVEAAIRTDPGLGLRHAEIAYRARPTDPRVASVLCEASLATGDVEQASRLAEELVEAAPNDQYAIALQATAWRLAGDPRFDALYDYERFVRPHRIDTPDGWSSLDAYLADLQASLLKLHGLKTHPIGQSLRHGSQTSQSLKNSDDPAIKAFFQAVDGPIRRHIAGLGKGRDPVRRRIASGYRFSGIWSVRLRPHGFHVDHVHPQGWFSSACYISLPKAVEAGGQEGWIKFGQPGCPTQPPLEPQHSVKPEPGLLVLFPSYMWHGTVPFSGDEPRLTIAFDLVPA